MPSDIGKFDLEDKTFVPERVLPSNTGGCERGSPVCPDGIPPVTEIGLNKDCGAKNAPKLPRPVNSTKPSTEIRSETDSKNKSNSDSCSTSLGAKVDPLQRGVPKRGNQAPRKTQAQYEYEAYDEAF